MSEHTPGHSLDVLLLADRTPPAIGGRESVLREILVRQPAETTRLVAPRQRGAASFDRSARVAVDRFPRGAWLGESGSKWLRRTCVQWILRRRTTPMVVAFDLGANAALALERKRTAGASYLLHLEGPELHAARRRLRAGGEAARLVQETFDESEAILVASRACRLEAYKTGVLPHRLEVIPPGVDLERFRPGPKNEALLRRAEAGQGPVLLAIAGEGPGKDPEMLLRAAAAVRGARDPAVLVVLGPATPAWRSLAGRLRLQSSVRFLGVVPESELADWYRTADVLVAAHREDRDKGVVAGIEISIVEALASGLPIVATRVPSVEDLVRIEDVGVLVECEAHTKMARAIGELLRARDHRAEMARAGRERAEAEYAAPTAAARFREFLEVVHFRRLGRGRLVHEEEPAPAERPAA